MAPKLRRGKIQIQISIKHGGYQKETDKFKPDLKIESASLRKIANCDRAPRLFRELKLEHRLHESLVISDSYARVRRKLEAFDNKTEDEIYLFAMETAMELLDASLALVRFDTDVLMPRAAIMNISQACRDHLNRIHQIHCESYDKALSMLNTLNKLELVLS